ncbi:FAD-dependent pyridine nucleotide-disulfide oxidoreductase [Lojkania enalia]|uniref:FAD-dependent pyridine nucleotide-disulfide oxidoreductase n=1 Tax=Lojkania enalia TaxID=147567 RepID=A0A9P4N5U0_9PLEO|nr:FAD-dependent pyridine nucleotide-disulfide oxidoreductase [Didymosphaeria enalia]
MPSAVSKRIVVVGGVAGGMAAATRARRLDENASITVFDKGPYTGFANCGIPYALDGVIPNDSSLILQTPEGFKNRFNIDVHVNAEVTKIDRAAKTVEVKATDEKESKQYPYDSLILSQGAEAFVPPVDGIQASNVFTLQTIPELQSVKNYIAANSCKSVAIIGGGFIGLEAAENLRLHGLDVSIIEYMPHVFPPVDSDIAEPIHSELRKNGIQLYLNARMQGIEAAPEGNGRASAIVLSDGIKVPFDLAIVAVGVRPRVSLAQEAGLQVDRNGVVINEFMQTSDPDIYAVGDMICTPHRITSRPMRVALAGPAARQGRLAADKIFGYATAASAYRGNIGTSACKVFDLTVGIAGLSVKVLEDMGLNPLWVTVHPPDHAGYYPTAHPITLKVAFEPGTGRLLGAQAIGLAGVDKRIDVLATAMQGNMTITDLTHLELAYAPPYGSAKDPVNMAGYVGSNVLADDVQVVHAAEINIQALAAKGTQIVDVRSPSEFSKGHLPNAVNIPVNNLRKAVEAGSLDQNKDVVVYCQVGYRGYLAYRILKHKGFNVVNLDGGYKAVSEGGYKALQANL